MPDPVLATKIKNRKERLTFLLKQYEAAWGQLNRTQSEMDKVTLQQQISDLEQEMEQIKQELEKLEAEQQQRAWSEANYDTGQLDLPVETVPSPKSTIPVLSDFVGRETELAELAECTKKSRLIVVLGPAGIGKSSLLAQLAQQFIASEMKVFWHTFTPLTSFEEVIGQLAVFIDEHQLRPLYGALLQAPSYSLNQKLDLLLEGLNALNPVLFFDDYHQLGENAKIAHLLNDLVQKLDRGLIFVTSRDRPSFDSVVQRLTAETVEIQLGGLSVDEICQFFSALNQEVQEELCKFLADEFGGLAMALKLVSNLLNAGYDQETLTTNLKTQVSRPILDYLFEELWRYLDTEARDILKLGALLLLPFRASQITRLSGSGRVREHLVQLEVQSLLHEVAVDGYVVHDIVKPLARSFCDDIAAQQIAIAHKLMGPEPEFTDDVIEATIQFYQAEQYDQAARLMTEELQFVHPPSYYQSVIERLLDVLDEGKYQRGVLSQENWLWLCDARGHYLSQRRLWEQAEVEYQQMLQLAQMLSDKAAIAIALQNMGVNHYRAKQHTSAEQAQRHENLAEQRFRSSLIVKKEINDWVGQAQLHGNLGNLYLDREEFTLAHREFDLQLSCLEQVEVDEWYYIPVYGNYGRLFYEQGQFELAITYNRRALAIAETYDAPADVARLSHNLGHAYQGLGDNQQAIEHYRQAHQLASEINLLDIQDWSAVALGKIYHELGELDQSIEYFEVAGEIRSELQDLAGLASIYFDISTFHYLTNNTAQAREYALKGLELFEHLTSASQIDRFAENAYQLFRQADLLDLARRHFKTLRKRILSREDFSPHALIKVYEILGQIYLELSKTRIANWCFDQLIELISQNISAQEVVEYTGWVGGLFEKTEKFAYALDWYGRAVEIAKKEEFKRLEAGMLYNTGNIYSRLEKFSKAKTDYHRALTIAEQINDLELQDWILHNIGYIAREQKDFENAITLLKRSLEIAKQRLDTYSQATTLNNLGLTYQDAGRFEDALACFEESVSVSRAANHQDKEANTLISLGNFYRKLDQFDQADQYYRESLSIARESEDWELEENAVLSLGYLYHQEGKFAQIEDLFQETGQKTSDLMRYAQLADFLILGAEVDLEAGDLENAAQNFAQGLLVSFYAGGSRLMDNATLESPIYLREFREVWAGVLRALHNFLDQNNRAKAKEFCEYLLKALSSDEDLHKYRFEPLQPYLKAIRFYLEEDGGQSFKDFLTSLDTGD